MFQSDIAESKLQCYTPVAEMERQRKITAQRKALKSEGTMGHVKFFCFVIPVYVPSAEKVSRVSKNTSGKAGSM